MVDYNKTLNPPEDRPVYETSTGLKFWAIPSQVFPVSWASFGWSSLVTEDPAISMHRFSEDLRRDGFLSSYAFYYGETTMAFQVRNPQKPRPDVGLEGHESYRVIDMGGDVRSPYNVIRRDEIGEFAIGEKGKFQSYGWSSYGRSYGPNRVKFPNHETQSEMLEIWLELLALLPLGWHHGPGSIDQINIQDKERSKFEFSPGLLKLIEDDHFIEGEVSFFGTQTFRNFELYKAQNHKLAPEKGVSNSQVEEVHLKKTSGPMAETMSGFLSRKIFKYSPIQSAWLILGGLILGIYVHGRVILQESSLIHLLLIIFLLGLMVGFMLMHGLTWRILKQLLGD